jgi:hypothetical protein
MIILIPPIETMIREVEQYIYLKTGRKVNILLNDPFNIQRHIEMLRDAYKIVKKDETR